MDGSILLRTQPPKIEINKIDRVAKFPGVTLGCAEFLTPGGDFGSEFTRSARGGGGGELNHPLEVVDEGWELRASALSLLRCSQSDEEPVRFR